VQISIAAADAIAAIVREPDTLVTESAASEVLSVPVPTLRRWRRLRIGPEFVKLGDRLVRYRVGALEAFIKAGCRPTEHATR
jgi:hypothetical protein